VPYPREDRQLAKAAPVENKAAKATSAKPPADHRIVVAAVYVSYNAKPTGGKLIITDGMLTIEHDVPTEGLIPLEPGIAFGPGLEVTAELTAGGASVLGKVTLITTLE
jgi:hypothetical protein